MSAVTADERAAPVSERPAPNPPRKRWTRFILPVYSILVILYMTSPVLTMILYGFNDIPGERQTPKFWGFTLHWYRDLFGANSNAERAVTQAWTAVGVN